ncbi:MAG TPA: type IV pilus twitching motility protein PilT [Thermoleophilaceae bacterium]|jgi:twitching motility protein PilT|nr:type IV pilus twitching motility protein PilT [Thermoleophilaceae bacterium]
MALQLSSTALKVAEAMAAGKREYVEQALDYLVTKGGSDLHLTAGSSPLVRLHGALIPIPGTPELTAEDTQDVLNSFLSDPEKREEFAQDNEVDFSFELDGVARFRVNAYRQRGSVSMVLRAIPFTIRTIDELDLPPVVEQLAREERGLILVTGATGSGKSTTLASIIDYINTNTSKHIVTIEDPIEFLYSNKSSIISQREVGVDTASFGRALRRVLRQDPDVILIGEIRDQETMETALAAAETGHLVLSTLHTLNASETISRIISLFPPHMQQQARFMLSGTLRGVIAQRLVPSVDGSQRIPVVEALVSTGRVRDLILEPSRAEDLNRIIHEGEYYGMQTFDQSLIQRVDQGLISMDEALRVANNPSDMKLQAQSHVAQVPGV